MNTPTRLLGALSLGLLAGSFSLASALPSHPLTAVEEGVLGRCGSPERGLEESIALLELLKSISWDEGLATDVEIPVAWHIVHHTNGTGNVPDTMIQDQLDVLNAAYVGTGFSFRTGSTDRTANNNWFNNFIGYESQIYNALAIDPAHNLNLYISNIPYLGFAYLPGYFSESDPFNAVVVLYSSLPGGGEYPYDEGDTATHEVGHYLGLDHTFYNGCSYPGDSVDDTPYESSPAFGCPYGRDTCSQPGDDPITNFMDYSDDACMIEFTPGQAERMQQAVELYRPSLLDGSCDLEVVLSDYPVAVDRGSMVSFDAAATNACSGALTLDRAEISASGPANWHKTIYDGAPVSVNAGGQIQQTINVYVPEIAPVGNYNVEVTIHRGATELDADSFTLDVN